MKFEIKEEDLTVTEALYMSEYGTILALRDEHMANLKDYTQISKPKTTTYELLSPEEIQANAIQSVDLAIEELRLEMSKKMQNLLDKKASLLSLTHQTTETASIEADLAP